MIQTLRFASILVTTIPIATWLIIIVMTILDLTVFVELQKLLVFDLNFRRIYFTSVAINLIIIYTYLIKMLVSDLPWTKKGKWLLAFSFLSFFAPLIWTLKRPQKNSTQLP